MDGRPDVGNTVCPPVQLFRYDCPSFPRIPPAYSKACKVDLIPAGRLYVPGVREPTHSAEQVLFRVPREVHSFSPTHPTPIAFATGVTCAPAMSEAWYPLAFEGGETVFTVNSALLKLPDHDRFRLLLVLRNRTGTI